MQDIRSRNGRNNNAVLYLSPSDSFKVSIDARHLLLAFGMSAVAVAESRDSLYVPESYKLVDLHDLLCGQPA
ncbi:hypothetical protein BH18ACI5_BH18ACI5_23350 [soil metagenome]